MSGNMKCPFCNHDRGGKTDEEMIGELMKRAAANDAGAIYALGSYHNGRTGLQHDRAKAIELWTQAAELGSSSAHKNLGNEYHNGGDLNKAKFHFEAAAMAGHEAARCNLGIMEGNSGNGERGLKHLRIAASAGSYLTMAGLITFFEGYGSIDAIDSTLIAYNNSCAEMRSAERDAAIRAFINRRI
jgi:TPR repeat protein